MKILYLRTQYWFNLKAGGSVGHTSGVINSLRKKEDLHVVSNDHLADVEHNIEQIKPVKISRFPNYINEFLYNFKIIFKLRKRAFSGIYQRYSGGSFSGAFLSQINRIPFILEFNSSDVWKLKNWEKRNRFIGKVYLKYIQLPLTQIIESYNLKKSDLIVVVSDVLKSDLIERGIESGKILVNPNGIDEKKYHPDILSFERKKKYQLQDKTVLGFIGTFGPWHGTENIVKAYNGLLSKNIKYKKNTRLILIGDGIRMPEIEKLLQKYQIQENVILTGIVKQNDGPNFLSLCDILINATVPNPDGTRFFGSPTKLFEYMAMGKAIVCSDLEQMGTILNHKETALLYPPNQIKKLQESLDLLINDIEFRESLGKNARKEAVKKYTWDKHVERILNSLQNGI